MFLTDEEDERIYNCALEFLLDYGITSYPIKPFDVCKHVGVDVVGYSEVDPFDIYNLVSESFDSFLLTHFEKGLEVFKIFYNDNPSRRRQRISFSICHELGHIVLGHRGLEESKLENFEANRFAGYILAPPVLLNEFCYSSSESTISSAFQISKECASLSRQLADRRFQSKTAYTEREKLLLKSASVDGIRREFEDKNNKFW